MCRKTHSISSEFMVIFALFVMVVFHRSCLLCGAVVACVSLRCVFGDKFVSDGWFLNKFGCFVSWVVINLLE